MRERLQQELAASHDVSTTMRATLDKLVMLASSALDGNTSERARTSRNAQHMMDLLMKVCHYTLHLQYYIYLCMYTLLYMHTSILWRQNERNSGLED